MRTRDIYISAGHSNVAGRDRGAASNGFIEGVLTADLRRDMVAELTRRGLRVFADADDSILSQTLTWMRNRTTNRCIVLDLHWNSAIPSATGTETFVPSDAGLFELSLAADFSKAIADTLGIRMRGNFKGYTGVKSELESHHGRLGWMRLTGQNILSEVCFISNQNDMRLYNENRSALIVALCDVLQRYANTEIGIINTTTGALNVRSTPAIASNNIVGRVAMGSIVFVTEERNGFVRIPNGWVSRQFVKTLE